MALLEVNDLRVHFLTPKGVNRAVDGISFSLNQEETVAIVGESGSGKSVTAQAILGLLAQPPAKVAGRVLFDGTDLLGLDKEQMRLVRGRDIGVVFQDPMASLNPLLTIGYQLAERLRIHDRVDRSEANRRSAEILEKVGLPDVDHRLKQYPHELSGGMRQRVMIAMALIGRPKLLIADEPTTALDVTIQAQILDLLRTVKDQFGTSVVLITHDFGVVAETAQQVIVMYAGRAVEKAPVEALFAAPRHPYTAALIKTIPELGTGTAKGKRLEEIPGMVPDLRKPLAGCAFASRCARTTDVCRSVRPRLEVKADGHLAACHHSNREHHFA